MDKRLSTPGVPGHLSKQQRGVAMVVMTLAFLVGGILVALPRNDPAHAAGATITLVPKSAAYKAQSGIVVKGANYAANENVKIYWNYTGPGTGALIATTTADTSTGSFSTK